MQLRNFVSASSVLLVAWLGATFFWDVPSQRYPKLEKHTTTSALPSDVDPAGPVVMVKPAEALTVSVSR